MEVLHISGHPRLSLPSSMRPQLTLSVPGKHRCRLLSRKEDDLGDADNTVVPGRVVISLIARGKVEVQTPLMATSCTNVSSHAEWSDFCHHVCTPKSVCAIGHAILSTSGWEPVASTSSTFERQTSATRALRGGWADGGGADIALSACANIKRRFTIKSNRMKACESSYRTEFMFTRR